MTDPAPMLWAILLAPLAAAAAIGLFGRRSPRASAALSTGAILASFALALSLFAAVRDDRAGTVVPLPWLTIGSLHVGWGLTLDRLSTLMMLVVTGVGSAIHIYSIGYMRGDRGFPRFFASLSLFTFSMLGVVLASNFIQMFVFWELVGVSSYLLIGFWFERPAAAAAGQKAFVVNRIGDFGFLLGILVVWTCAGTFDFRELETRWPALGLTPTMLGLAAALVFCGAMGKSAQLPLHVWLPDAMEGPTPVSALIHAATMVAAGVYMLCRVGWLMAASPAVMAAIAWIGGLTALMAALIAVAQDDLKRILAYSTLSQLGYMVLAFGLGAPVQAMFHLTTHAFFKALLFLAAGSVLIALHHEQDIWKMGGLRRRMPLTFACFALGTLALGGVWPLSGFFSKDEILFSIESHHETGLLVVGVFTALLTAFYMGRAILVVFFGRPRDVPAFDHAKESPAVITGPLVALAILTVIGGWHEAVPAFLQPGFRAPAHPWPLVLAMLAIPLAGFALAFAVYGRSPADDSALRRALGPLYVALRRKFWFDEAYQWLVDRVQGGAAALCERFEHTVLRRMAERGATEGVRGMGAVVRRAQGGNVRAYVLLTVAGMSAVLIWMVLG